MSSHPGSPTAMNALTAECAPELKLMLDSGGQGHKGPVSRSIPQPGGAPHLNPGIRMLMRPS